MNQFEVLADVAFRSKNYDEAYKYYTQTIEGDINNAQAWVFKGICAGHLSTAESPRVEECIALVEHGVKANSGESASQKLAIDAADALIDVYEHNIRSLNNALVGKLEDARKNTQVGNSGLGHLLAQSVNKVVQVQLQAESRVKLLDLMKLMIKIDPSVENYRVYKNAIDGLLLHSKNNQNYLESNKNNEALLASIKEQKSKIERQLLELSPDERKKYDANPNNAKKEGCFIATAAYGDYDHPKVQILRQFRDEILRRSKLGDNFIRLYYRASPNLANTIRSSNRKRAITKFLIIYPLFKLAQLALLLNKILEKPNR